MYSSYLSFIDIYEKSFLQCILELKAQPASKYESNFTCKMAWAHLHTEGTVAKSSSTRTLRDKM